MASATAKALVQSATSPAALGRVLGGLQWRAIASGACIATVASAAAPPFGQQRHRPQRCLFAQPQSSSSSSSRQLSTAAAAAAGAVPLRRCLVAEAAPAFSAQAVMPSGEFAEVSLAALLEKKKYVCLLFYPLDFTFVCPSELIAFNKKVEEFDRRGVQLLGVSVDSHFTHLAWQKVSPKEGGIGKMNFPLVSDLSKSMARDYGVLLNESLSLRGLFLIDQSGVVRHRLVNDLPLGRSVDETLRIIDALQHTEKHGEVCPANWRKGDEAMKPSAEGVAAYLGKHS